MPANSIRLTFSDGTVRDLAVSPKALVASERRWGADISQHQIESGFFMAWVTLGKPGGPDGFEEWLDNIEAVEPIEDPTTAATPSELSPPLPSPQV